MQEFEAKEDDRIAALEAENEEGEESQVQSPSKERKPFDVEGFISKWDEENPKVDIPPEVKDYIDNDFDLELDESRE